MPVWLIPIIINLGSRVIDMMFDRIEQLPPEKKSKVLNKIEKQDEKNSKKAEEQHEKH